MVWSRTETVRDFVAPEAPLNSKRQVLLGFCGGFGVAEQESWQNGYCTGLENRRPQGLTGSNPVLSARVPPEKAGFSIRQTT